MSAVIYATFGLTAVSLACAPAADTNGHQKVTDMTGSCSTPPAVVKSDVTDDFDRASISTERARRTRRLGAIGDAGSGIALGLIGFFLVLASITFDASRATGLDGALRRVALNPWGELVVAVVGIGFVACGVFCLGTFTRRRLEAP